MDESIVFEVRSDLDQASAYVLTVLRSYKVKLCGVRRCSSLGDKGCALVSNPPAETVR